MSHVRATTTFSTVGILLIAVAAGAVNVQVLRSASAASDASTRDNVLVITESPVSDSPANTAQAKADHPIATSGSRSAALTHAEANRPPAPNSRRENGSDGAQSEADRSSGGANAHQDSSKSQSSHDNAQSANGSAAQRDD